MTGFADLGSRRGSGPGSVAGGSVYGGTKRLGSVGSRMSAYAAAAVGSAAAPISLLVDAESSPQKVLDSLDTVMLSHRIVDQENTISELRGRIEELEEVRA